MAINRPAAVQIACRLFFPVKTRHRSINKYRPSVTYRRWPDKYPAGVENVLSQKRGDLQSHARTS